MPDRIIDKQQGVKVLSLFDGMSCGMLAFGQAGMKVDRYVAYEIDKYAIQVSKHNFPMIEQKGDVFQADFTEYEGFDAVVGGSPCTYWSIAQTKNRESEAHGIGWELFQQYVRAIREAKPKFFIYENNKSMANAIKEEISNTFGFEPIMINSALVSAQRRQRYYWVGVRQEDGTYRKANIIQPEDKGILLRDVLDDGWVTDRAKRLEACDNKANCLTSVTTDSMVAEPVAVRCRGRYDEDGGCARYEASCDLKANTLDTNASNGSMVAEPVCMRYERTEEGKRLRSDYEAGIIHHGYSEHRVLQPRDDGKTNTLTTVQKDNQILVPLAGRFVGRRINEDGHRDDNNECLEYVQRCEVNEDPSKTNCLTTVQKDNVVLEPLEPIGSTVLNTNPSGRGIGSNNSPKAVLPVEVRGMSYPLKDTTGGDSGVIATLDMPGSHDILTRVFGTEGKAPTITAGTGGNKEPKVFSDTQRVKSTTKTPVYTVEGGQIEIKGKRYPIKLPDGDYIIRKLTVSECKRLQTVPEWYDMSVISNSQAYKCLGNGWTVDVIAHLIDGVVNESRSKVPTMHQSVLF